MPPTPDSIRTPADRLFPKPQRWLKGWFWLLLSLSALPLQAQVSDAKVEALVEALRLSAPPQKPDSGLYSDWQIKPDNIKRWSMPCLQRDVTPEQLAADSEAARRMVACVMGGVLRDQFAASQQNEIIAVQRAAAWWLTGEPDHYRDDGASPYTLKVLEAYLRFF
ncbi:MAG TPA: hypothetical protein PLU26_14520 [Candidatus Competibacter sp.]|nr:hypothetical protein [Candidatus Competibacteraceae bacterium]HUM95671.1 hypothetical protein [Candidatus Competibacter sp.]